MESNESKQHVVDYEQEWRQKQLLESHAIKMEEVKARFLKEKVEKDREYHFIKNTLITLHNY